MEWLTVPSHRIRLPDFTLLLDIYTGGSDGTRRVHGRGHGPRPLRTPSAGSSRGSPSGVEDDNRPEVRWRVRPVCHDPPFLISGAPGQTSLLSLRPDFELPSWPIRSVCTPSRKVFPLRDMVKDSTHKSLFTHETSGMGL